MNPRYGNTMDVPLASYRQRASYTPRIGDFVIWSGWFSTWYGVVSSAKGNKIWIVFESLPILLFSMEPTEYPKNTHEVDLDKIISASPGIWAIQRHDQERNDSTWYI